MRAETFLSRLGLGAGPDDPPFAWRILLVCLALYLASFALFYPRVATNTDEAMYLRQTRLLLEGHSTVINVDPLTGEEVVVTPSTYAVGTAYLMAPFVALAGWRGAFVLPCLSLLLAVLFTGRWLQDEKRSPIFALILLGFPSALVMGRVAMSDVPSMALVSLGLWLFWRGLDRGPGWWLASGLVAGASMAVRLTNPAMFIPLFAGAVLRRETRCWALVVGGLVGLGIRMLAMDFYFGDALYERVGYDLASYLAPATVHERLPMFALGLLVFVPGGFLLSLAYRGRRRPEVIATILLFPGLYLVQRFSGFELGLPKRIILLLRYYLPVIPLMAFAMAEAVPRLWRLWLERRPAARQPRIRAVAAALLGVWMVGVAAATALVNPTFAAWSATQAEISEELHRHVGDDAVLVTNWAATRKFLRPIERRYTPLHRSDTSPDVAANLLRRHGEFYVAFLDRSDNEFWRRDLADNEAWIGALKPAPELLFDRRVTSTDRLRIWRVSQPPAPAS